jgi:hypothetical protein
LTRKPVASDPAILSRSIHLRNAATLPENGDR